MNFVIEGGFNFKEELLKEDVDDANVCLITGEVLTGITLTCGHSFNMEPLFKEVFNQKINIDFKNDAPLRDNEYKCPYCRAVQTKLIPGQDKKVFRVNTLDSDYELDSKICRSLDYFNLFSVGECCFPECTKKYVFYRKCLNKFVCCVHSKITKSELNRHKKIQEYKALYPNDSIENILLKITGDEIKDPEQPVVYKTIKSIIIKELKNKKEQDKIKAKEEKAKAKEAMLKEKEDLKKKKQEEKIKAAEEKKKVAAEKMKAKQEKKAGEKKAEEKKANKKEKKKENVSDL